MMNQRALIISLLVAGLIAAVTLSPSLTTTPSSNRAKLVRADEVATAAPPTPEPDRASIVACRHESRSAFSSSFCDIRDAQIDIDGTIALFTNPKQVQNESTARFALGDWQHYRSWATRLGPSFQFMARNQTRDSADVCAHWIEHPVLFIFQPFTRNYWHSFADMTLSAFSTLIDAGLWNASSSSFLPFQVSVQQYASFPSAYHNLNGFDGAKHKSRALDKLVRSGAWAVDSYRLLRLLTPDRALLLDSNFSDRKVSGSGDENYEPFESPAPTGLPSGRVCYRRLLVGATPTLDSNVDAARIDTKSAAQHYPRQCLSPPTASSIALRSRAVRPARIDGAKVRACALRLYVAYAERSFGIEPQPDILPSLPVLTIINRAKTAYGGRVLANAEQLQEWATAFGIRTRLVDFADIDLPESMRLMRETTIFMGLHGTATQVEVQLCHSIVNF
jgi:hypothetical protein